MTSSERTPRWFERVLPVTGIALAAIALAALAVPGFRDQVALSASHRPEPYVELYFARTPDGTQLICTRKVGEVRVSFAVASHLADTQDVDYDVSVDGVEQTGSRAVDPGETAVVTRTFELDRGAYDLAVRLPGLDQQLSAHCPGARGARS